MDQDAPTPPDFPSLDAAAFQTEGRRTFILSLIGNLSFAWSNNESLFIHLIKILMRTDEASAVIVFVSLNTARARMEIVERLARAQVRDRALLKELEWLVGRFAECTRIRNEFNHCLYGIDAQGILTHTQAFRIRDVAGSQALERPKPIDEDRIDIMLQTIEELKHLNRAIWNILPRLQADLSLISP